MNGLPGRRRASIAVVIAAVALLVVDALALVFHTGDTPVTVNQAIQRYRQSLKTSGPGQAVSPTSAPFGGRPNGSPPSTTAAPSTPPPGPDGGSTGSRSPFPAVAAGAGGAPGAPGSGSQGSAPPSRSSTTNTAGPAPTASPVPGTGVYVYDTTGYEQLSTPGSRRPYPSQTTITATSNGPGCQSIRWQPFEEHWEQYNLCYRSGHQVDLDSIISDVSFYNVADRSDLTCASPANYWRPPTDRPGTAWSFACSGSSARYQIKGTVVGTEPVNVGGQPVSAVHLHLDITISGSEQGQSPEDLWLATSNSLPLKLTGTANARESSGPLGDVTYQEQFSLTLESLSPQR